MEAYWTLATLHDRLHYLAYTRKYASIALNIAKRIDNLQAVAELKLLMDRLAWLIWLLWEILVHQFCWFNWSISFLNWTIALWAYSNFLAAPSILCCKIGIFYIFVARMLNFWVGIFEAADKFYASLLHCAMCSSNYPCIRLRLSESISILPKNI